MGSGLMKHAREGGPLTCAFPSRNTLTIENFVGKFWELQSCRKDSVSQDGIEPEDEDCKPWLENALR